MKTIYSIPSLEQLKAEILSLMRKIDDKINLNEENSQIL